jgi:hypothetical protein
MMEKRLQKLARLWPWPPCPACVARPAIVCIAHEDDPVPDYPEGRCSACGGTLYSVPVLVGIDCDQI